MIDAAAAALDGLEGARRQVDLLTSPDTATVAIGADPSLVEAFVVPALATLLSTATGIRVTVRSGSADELLVLLRERQVEYFLGLRPDGPLEGVTLHPAGSVSVAPFCRPGHPLTRVPPQGIRVVGEYPIVVTTVPRWYQQQVRDDLPASAGRARAARGLVRTIELEDYGAVRALVRTSDAVGLAPRSAIAEAVATGELDERSELPEDRPVPVPRHRWVQVVDEVTILLQQKEPRSTERGLAERTVDRAPAPREGPSACCGDGQQASEQVGPSRFVDRWRIERGEQERRERPREGGSLVGGRIEVVGDRGAIGGSQHGCCEHLGFDEHRRTRGSGELVDQLRDVDLLMALRVDERGPKRCILERVQPELDAQDSDRLTRDQQVPVPAHDLDQSIAEVGALRQLEVELVPVGSVTALDHRQSEVLLAGEVRVDRACRVASRPGDLGDGRAVEATLLEKLLRGVE